MTTLPLADTQFGMMELTLLKRYFLALLLAFFFFLSSFLTCNVEIQLYENSSCKSSVGGVMCFHVLNIVASCQNCSFRNTVEVSILVFLVLHFSRLLLHCNQHDSCFIIGLGTSFFESLIVGSRVLKLGPMRSLNSIVLLYILIWLNGKISLDSCIFSFWSPVDFECLYVCIMKHVDVDNLTFLVWIYSGSSTNHLEWLETKHFRPCK